MKDIIATLILMFVMISAMSMAAILVNGIDNSVFAVVLILSHAIVYFCAFILGIAFYHFED
jgi:hypothetical protein